MSEAAETFGWTVYQSLDALRQLLVLSTKLSFCGDLVGGEGLGSIGSLGRASP
jgi:hypothetical protein